MCICVCVCVFVRAYMHSYFPDAAVSHCLHANGTKAYHWGMHPKPRESVPVTCTRRMHIVTYERTRVCVCLIVRASVARGFVLVHVYTAVGIMSHCVSRSVTLTCAPSVPDDSPTSVHA